MSVRVMALCWELPLDSSSKLILLALADHANDAGAGIYPGNARIAKKASLKIRQTQILLKHLEEHELIYRLRHPAGGRGKSVEWAINLDVLETVHSGAPLLEKGAVCDVKGCTLPEKACTAVRKTVQSGAPQPPEPSVKTSRTISDSKELLERIRVPEFDRNGDKIRNPAAYRRRVAETPGVLADLEVEAKAEKARQRGVAEPETLGSSLSEYL